MPDNVQVGTLQVNVDANIENFKKNIRKVKSEALSIIGSVSKAVASEVAKSTDIAKEMVGTGKVETQITDALSPDKGKGKEDAKKKKTEGELAVQNFGKAVSGIGRHMGNLNRVIGPIRDIFVPFGKGVMHGVKALSGFRKSTKDANESGKKLGEGTGYQITRWDRLREVLNRGNYTFKAVSKEKQAAAKVTRRLSRDTQACVSPARLLMLNMRGVGRETKITRREHQRFSMGIFRSLRTMRIFRFIMKGVNRVMRALMGPFGKIYMIIIMLVIVIIALLAFGDKIVQFFMDIGNAIMKLPGMIIEFVLSIPKYFYQMFTMIGELFGGLLASIGGVLAQLGSLIPGWFGSLLYKFGELLVLVFISIPAKLISWVAENGANFAKAGGDIVMNILSGLGQLGLAVGLVIVGIPLIIIEKIAEVAGKLLNAGAEMAGKIGEALKTAIIDYGSKIPGWLWDGFVAAPLGFLGDMTGGLMKGLGLASDISEDDAMKFAKDIGLVEAIEKEYEISSPSKVMMRLGMNIGEGLTLGVRQSMAEANAEIENNVKHTATTKSTLDLRPPRRNPEMDINFKLDIEGVGERDLAKLKEMMIKELNKEKFTDMYRRSRGVAHG